MQNVSDSWKEEQNKQLITAESFVEINLNVGDPEAQADAESSDNGHEKMSNTSSIVTEAEVSPELYAVLELNSWGLNGSRKIVPSSPPYGENGYIGDVLSDEDGYFPEDQRPKITISFSEVYDSLIPGLTITWSQAYNEWADTFKITAYNGNTEVASELFENSDIVRVSSIDISNYDRIVLEVIRWCLPYHRARIEKLIVGIERTYRKADLLNFSHNMTVDPLSASLPKDEIKFEILNLNGEYNPDNPSGVEKYLMERQKLSVKYGYKFGDSVEWIKSGKFYMSSWNSPQNGISATFSARDLLEYMDEKYTGPSIGTFMSIAQSALEQAGLPTLPDGTNPWILHPSLSTITAPEGVDLSKNSIAEVLQYVANGSCCVMYQDRDGIFRIEPLTKELTDYRIDKFNSYQNSEISLTKQLKSVNINNGQYVLSVGDVGEVQTVSNPLISAERAEVVAVWVADYLINRRKLSGQFRADPRLDALDMVTTETQFSENPTIITNISYTYNGAFRGSYEGRSMPANAASISVKGA